MANYNLTQTFADGQTHTVSFTIPEVAGTYQMTATLTNADGTTRTINAGTVVVAAKANTYNVAFDMGNSSALTTTLTTPALGATMTIPALKDGIQEIEYEYIDNNGVTKWDYAASGATTTIQVQVGTAVWYQITTVNTDLIPYNTEAGTEYLVPETMESGSLPVVYAKYNDVPYLDGQTVTASNITMDWMNTMGNTAAGISVYYSDAPSGTYYEVSSATSAVGVDNYYTTTKAGLTANTTYYFKAKYFDINGNIKDGDLSSYTAIKTGADRYTVTIPARQTGIKTLTYRYTNASGSTATVSAINTSQTITVKAGTEVTRAGCTLSNTTYYQLWSGNESSWTINSNYTLPLQYAQYKGSPTITSVSSEGSRDAIITGKNNLGMDIYFALYQSTRADGRYTKVASSHETVPVNATKNVLASNLEPSTTYYFRMAYHDPNEWVKDSSLSNYMSVTTDPEQTT